MLTVQETLKQLSPEDKADLIDTYISRFLQYPLDKFTFKNRIPDKIKKMTVEEWYKLTHDKIEKYIERLSSIEPKTPDYDQKDQPIIIGLQEFDYDMLTRTVAELFHLHQLYDAKNDEELANITPYGYEFEKQAYIVNYLISDDELTQYDLTDILADVLHEASWFGYADEHKAEENAKLEKSIQEADDGKTYSIEELLGPEEVNRPDKLDDEELRLERDIFDAQNKFSQHMKLKQLKKVLALHPKEEN